MRQRFWRKRARPPHTTAPAPAAAAAETDYPIAVNLPAGRYQLDPRHASVIFRIRHMDLAWFTARFDSIDATLELILLTPRSRLSASIDPNPVNTGVLSAQGERGFDRQIARALGGTPISFTATNALGATQPASPATFTTAAPRRWF